MAAGCSRSPEAPAEAVAVAGPGRGDHVVVELSSAEFFEARVLEAGETALKVEQIPGGKTHTVERADVYAITPAVAAARGRFYICRTAPQRWQPCQLEAATSRPWLASLPEGDSVRIEPADVLAPTDLTELNLRRRFERTQRVREFRAQAKKAGSPRVTVGWKPAPREAVLVSIGGSWLSAQVFEFLDSGYRVRLAGDGRIVEVPAGTLIPQPPYPGPAAPRSFVLARPDAIAEGWRLWQVALVADDHLTLQNEHGERKRATLRDVVPLVP